jgi:hypothetical protein
VKVIFLDVDGVLNSMESTLLYKTMNRLCPVRVGMVKRLCEEAGAEIVVSSSWRAPSLESTKGVLAEAGAKSLGPFIIGQTPRMVGKRGHEIAAWLKDNPVDAYVILDDDSDMLPGQAFVHTSMARGFCLDSYLDALKLLKPDHHHLSPMSLAAYRGFPRRKTADLWDDDEKLTAGTVTKDAAARRLAVAALTPPSVLVVPIPEPERRGLVRAGLRVVKP